jgi:predicted dehydrogenase
MAFKICVVCCGGISFHVHGPAYKKYAALHGDAVLAACCDIDEKKAQTFKEQFGFLKAYTDYREMLKTEKPDALCLNAPVPLTAALASSILEEGYPLILEKPPGRNREETLAILRAAEKRKAIHQVAFNRRFLPVLDVLVRELREQYRPEDIQNISCEFFRTGRKDPDFSTTAIHGIDSVKHTAGSEYEEIHFYYQEFPEAGNGVGNFYLQGRFVSGAFAQLRFCPMTGVQFERITVNAKTPGSPGNTYLAFLPYNDNCDGAGKLLHYRDGRLVKEVSGQSLVDSTEIFETNGFYGEIAAFFTAVRRGEQPASNLQSALQSVEIADCIRRRSERYYRNP